MGSSDREVCVAYIRRYIDERGYSPTWREIGEAIGAKSTRAVSQLLEELRHDGQVEWSPGQRRTLRLTDTAKGQAS